MNQNPARETKWSWAASDIVVLGRWSCDAPLSSIVVRNGNFSIMESLATVVVIYTNIPDTKTFTGLLLMLLLANA